MMPTTRKDKCPVCSAPVIVSSTGEGTHSCVYDYRGLEEKLSRAMVLAIKHCPLDHHDWDELTHMLPKDKIAEQYWDEVYEQEKALKGGE